jgi:4-oxalocrotonate tautomerase
MPFVRISASAAHSDDELTALSDGVFEAIVDVLGKPGDLRFQSIETYDVERLQFHRDFIGVPETGASVFVHITLSHGRTIEQRRALHIAVSRNIRFLTGLRSPELVILINERGAEAFSFGDGEARYLAPAAYANGSPHGGASD